jgi:hypothetical protein
MKTNESLQKVANELKNDNQFFKELQSNISIEFKKECQRFMLIKNSQILNVVDLDTIAQRASKNFLTQLIQD